MVDISYHEYNLKPKGSALRYLLAKTLRAAARYRAYTGGDAQERGVRYGWYRACMALLCAFAGVGDDDYRSWDLPALTRYIRIVAPRPKDWWEQLVQQYPELCALITQDGKLLTYRGHQPDISARQADTAA